jgi:hypothetical protein
MGAAQQADVFMTFDRRFISLAGGKGTCPVREPEAP